MLRIVRKTTLDALHADQTALAKAIEDAKHAKTEAEQATDSAIRAETANEDLMKRLGQAYADTVKAERRANEIQQARSAEVQDKATTDRQIAELRQDLDRLRDAAADTETGETVQAAIAYRILRDLYADAWREGLLPRRPFDVIAAVLGFDTAPQPTASTPTSRPAALRPPHRPEGHRSP